MTIDGLIAYLDEIQSGLRRANDKAVRMAALDTTAKVVKRIFMDGLLPNSRRSYTNERYKEKRKKRGFETSYVNLTFEGTLQKDFANSVTPIKEGVYAAGVKNKANVGKVDGANDRYDNPFSLTQDEAKSYQEVHKKELLRYVRTGS